MAAYNLEPRVQFDPPSRPIERLPRLLLDTTKNRLRLEKETLEDESLTKDLWNYETILVAGFSRPFDLERGPGAECRAVNAE